MVQYDVKKNIRLYPTSLKILNIKPSKIAVHSAPALVGDCGSHSDTAGGNSTFVDYYFLFEKYHFMHLF